MVQIDPPMYLRGDAICRLFGQQGTVAEVFSSLSIDGMSQCGFLTLETLYGDETARERDMQDSQPFLLQVREERKSSVLDYVSRCWSVCAALSLFPSRISWQTVSNLSLPTYRCLCKHLILSSVYALNVITVIEYSFPTTNPYPSCKTSVPQRAPPSPPQRLLD